MTDPISDFVAHSPPIDTVREEAARCAEETARYERGERGSLAMPRRLVSGEFSDAAFGVAAEVAMVVVDAMKAARKRWAPGLPWSVAAKMLRSGWQRGHRALAFETGQGPKS